MQPPQEYKTAGILTLIAGILNVLVSLIWMVMFIWFCVGVLWAIPLVIGVLEIMTGIGAMQGTPKPNPTRSGSIILRLPPPLLLTPGP